MIVGIRRLRAPGTSRPDRLQYREENGDWQDVPVVVVELVVPPTSDYDTQRDIEAEGQRAIPRSPR